VLQAGKQRDLALEALLCERVEVVGAQYLQRHQATETALSCQKHDRCCAVAELSADFIASPDTRLKAGGHGPRGMAAYIVEIELARCSCHPTTLERKVGSAPPS